MYEFQILLQRRRRLIARLVIAMTLGLFATLTILPRADAHVAQPELKAASLLDPYPMSGRHFGYFHPVI